MSSKLQYFGTTNARCRYQTFGMKQPDRLFHTWIVGQTGVGKTTLLENLIVQDLLYGRGCIVLDPHGDMVERLHAWVGTQPDINQRMVYLDAADTQNPYSYNPIRPVKPALRPLLASGLLAVFNKLWQEAWGVRMEHIFRNVLLTLLDQPQATLADIPRILTVKSYRLSAIRQVTNPHVRNFWEKEFAKYSYRYRADSIAPILNKVGGFLADPRLVDILVNQRQPLALRQLMDQQQVLLVNLAKGRLGDDAASLLGGLLVTAVGLAAFSRANIPESARVPCHLYLDEFHNFTTLSLVNMAAELRKFKLSLTLGHQYLAQLSPEIRSAVIGNVGTLACFRVGAEDTAMMRQQFGGVFSAADLLNLPNYQYYLKLMIDGRLSAPFSAQALPPMIHCNNNTKNQEEVRCLSKDQTSCSPTGRP